MEDVKELRQSIIETTYACFQKILNEIPKGVNVYIHKIPYDQVLVELGGFPTGISRKKDFFPSYICISDVEDMLREKEYHFQKDSKGWMMVTV